VGEKHKVPMFIPHILQRVPTYSFSVILDVGANTGQSCVPMAEALPDAAIYSFEPVRRTFQTLCANTAGHRSIRPFNLALGAVDGRAVMAAAPNSPSNRMIAGTASPSEGQAVDVMSGKSFCEKHSIRRVSFLKIDAEGHDLEVLKGFDDYLASVDFVQVEAGMNAYNRTHIRFQDFVSFLSAREFALFHIYGQAFEFKDGGRPIARRANPVFINMRLVGSLGRIT
jgi:FkbM family methyltransferase